MGLLLDCFRGSNSQPASQLGDATTPDMETRRQAAADAANRRLQQSERRGVDEDQLRRMKQQQIERERIEKQLSKLPKQNHDDDGLRWQTN